MKISSLKLNNFRNYDYLSLEMDGSTNIFYGNNAQGKTNILESIFLCGTSKSHRGTKDKDIIQFGKEEAHIELSLEKKGIPYQIDMHLKKNKSKGIAINKVPIKKASELFGVLNVVFFSPEDLNIIKNGPSERRKFIDLELSQLNRVYLSNLTKYNHIVTQRNHLLKNIAHNPSQKDMLDVWDIQMAEYGRKVMEDRTRFLEELNELIRGIHKKLTNGQEELTIIYEPSCGTATIEDVILKNRDRDLRTMTTNSGPHRDDICFMVNGIDIRKFGSQGQQRTAALSLKLSEIELVRKIIKDDPILLLDDVLSELDKQRQNCLLDSIDEIQTLVTCTGVDEFVNHRFSINKIFHVQNGQVIKEN